MLQKRVKAIDKKILRLSLKYNFVTPLTSMVVTKPNVDDNEIAGTAPPIPTPEVRDGFPSGSFPLFYFVMITKKL